MSTEVKILGKAFSIKSEYDSNFASQSAAIVSAKMEDLRSKAGSVPMEKIAILTAMNLAGEVLRMQKENGELRGEFKEKTRKLIELIDSHIA